MSTKIIDRGLIMFYLILPGCFQTFVWYYKYLCADKNLTTTIINAILTFYTPNLL